MRCKDCGFWSSKISGGPTQEGYHVCLQPMGDVSRNWRPNRIYYEDDFWTGPEFGCINWVRQVGTEKSRHKTVKI